MVTKNPKRERTAPIDSKLLELLVCPLNKGPLEYDAEKSELRAKGTGLAYPVRDGIPVMLPSEARQYEPDPKDKATKR